MRVIAGSAGGRPLKGPISSNTRPTADKTKGAIFSMLESLMLSAQDDQANKSEVDETDSIWDGLRVLDLYAGTGGLGIEALSRGAAWADFVEQHRATCRLIEENLRLTGLLDHAFVHCRSVAAFLSSSQQGTPYDIILLDPPYADTQVIETVRSLVENGLAQPGTLIMTEHASRMLLPEQISTASGILASLRNRRHGDTNISIYRYNHTDEGSLNNKSSEKGL